MSHRLSSAISEESPSRLGSASAWRWRTRRCPSARCWEPCPSSRWIGSKIQVTPPTWMETDRPWDFLILEDFWAIYWPGNQGNNDLYTSYLQQSIDSGDQGFEETAMRCCRVDICSVAAQVFMSKVDNSLLYYPKWLSEHWSWALPEILLGLVCCWFETPSCPNPWFF